MKGYRNFALATIVVALIVAMIADEDQPSSSPEHPDNAIMASVESQKASSPHGESPEFPPEAVPPRSAAPWRKRAYETAAAQTGIYESRTSAALEGRAPRQIATAEEMRRLIDESRKRSGDASP
ncbi:hypothetical protein [Novosphingobium sp. M1R2S20]|uniref:Uncharacterized protein n=1 Tax=Novosphingobium rhizovicinum TaxID=3228928 RepID=A0ABV3RC70_9SPHN